MRTNTSPCQRNSNHKPRDLRQKNLDITVISSVTPSYSRKCNLQYLWNQKQNSHKEHNWSANFPLNFVRDPLGYFWWDYQPWKAWLPLKIAWQRQRATKRYKLNSLGIIKSAPSTFLSHMSFGVQTNLILSLIRYFSIGGGVRRSWEGDCSTCEH